MRFIRVQDHHLADPLVVYLFRPRQVPQPSVVIFLELSVANFILHADKYPDLPRAGNASFCNEFDFGRYAQQRMVESSGITMFTQSRGVQVESGGVTAPYRAQSTRVESGGTTETRETHPEARPAPRFALPVAQYSQRAVQTSPITAGPRVRAGLKTRRQRPGYKRSDEDGRANREGCESCGRPFLSRHTHDDDETKRCGNQRRDCLRSAHRSQVLLPRCLQALCCLQC